MSLSPSISAARAATSGTVTRVTNHNNLSHQLDVGQNLKLYLYDIHLDVFRILMRNHLTPSHLVYSEFFFGDMRYQKQFRSKSPLDMLLLFNYSKNTWWPKIKYPLCSVSKI